MTESSGYIEPTQNSGMKLVWRKITISGEEAFQRYIQHTLPFLQESGGEIVFMGKDGEYLIGPEAEH
ncbi:MULTISPECIES: hypothetical protein [unclassified Paenibacillus]|uniref:hypothetical protein n=1 Tax=unclassified Paenibacillus TaxID=185978 RepID=UPI0003E2BFF4|nr:hypothetical protein [Paenibacillus sp. FSL H7-689]ETT47854.1 hypothetical protein C170_21475 [Paenibacillus sp. FSL H7-689]